MILQDFFDGNHKLTWQEINCFLVLDNSVKQLLEVTDMYRSRLPAVFLDVRNLMLGILCWGGGGLQGILGGGGPYSFPNPDPISTPVFRPDL